MKKYTYERLIKEGAEPLCEKCYYEINAHLDV